ncbi:SDR family NAD(P)-dependent oxidoreductase [Cellvibrio fontiphilus]|jgi:short-subunit dehydrogenase|uniref:SDR family NAD(P)-dependent oxidoreductase n=1 Tax=Cellvibrio fontiphilus TaxID=1815559 RepID=A0ABV7FI96_9GAMM
MTNNPEQRSVLVTGASSGIGRDLALAYLAQGEKVFALARSTTALAELVSAYPHTCIAVTVDLTDDLSCQQAAEQIAQHSAYLDIAILNAGTCEYVDVNQLSIEPFDKVMAINWRGTLNSLIMCLPFLRNKKGSQLVGVSSMASVLPMPRSQAYGASKIALEYLLNSLRVDLGGAGIDISIVRPGFVTTPLTARNDFPMPFIVDSETAVKKIVQGIAKRQWIIAFPWQLVGLMRFIALLPLKWQTSLLQKISRNSV